MERLLAREDGLESCLEHVDLPTLLRCKAVSRSWARACRRTLASETFHERLTLVALIESRAPARAFVARLAAGGYEELLIPDKDGNLPIHRALEARLPEAVLLAMLQPNQHQRAADDVAEALVRLTAYHHNRWAMLPLHMAASSRASEAVVARLLALLPDSVRRRGRGARTPLHLAVTHGAPTAVVLSLLKAHPEAARERSADRKEGKPLHLAASNGASAECIRALLSAYPEAAACECGSVGLPIHGACALGAPRPHPGERVEIVAALLESFPEGARHPRRGDLKLPIHLAAEAKARAAAAEEEKAAAAEEKAAEVEAAEAKVESGAQLLAACSAVVDELVRVHPPTSEWSVEELLRAREVGEAALLEKLRTYLPTPAQRQENVLLARSCGAPALVMRALAVGPPAVREREPSDEAWEVPAAEGLHVMLPGQSTSAGDAGWTRSDAGAQAVAEAAQAGGGRGKARGTASKESSEAAAAAGPSYDGGVSASRASVSLARLERLRVERTISQGASSMGTGGSYVIPPSRLADTLIRAYGGTPGAPPTPTRFTVAWSPGVRVRAEPSADAPVLLRLKAGVAVGCVRDVKSGWYRVTLPRGGEGWVAASGGALGAPLMVPVPAERRVESELRGDE